MKTVSRSPNPMKRAERYNAERKAEQHLDCGVSTERNARPHQPRCNGQCRSNPNRVPCSPRQKLVRKCHKVSNRLGMPRRKPVCVVIFILWPNCNDRGVKHGAGRMRDWAISGISDHVAEHLL